MFKPIYLGIAKAPLILFMAGAITMAADSRPSGPPTITRPTDGQQTVEGLSASGDTYTIVRIKVFTPEGTLAQFRDGLVQTKRDFSVALTTPLSAGQVVMACPLVGADEISCTAPVTVAAAAASTSKPAVKPAADPAPAPDPCAAGTDNDAYPRIIVDPLSGGAAKISGSAPVLTGKASFCIGNTPLKLGSDGNAGTDTPVAGGKWSATLQNPLKSGDNLHVIVTSTSPAVRLSFDATVPATCTAPLEFTTSPKEGQTAIYGIASPSSDALKCGISVFINGDEATVADNQGKDANSTATDGEGHFTATLKNSLVAGQCVSLVQYTQGQRPNTDDVETARECKAVAEQKHLPRVPSQLVSSYLDLGRARTYFAGGVVMSANGGNFNSQDLFLAFDYDKNWLWGGPKIKSIKHYTKYTREGKDEQKPEINRVMFNTFFEARLTAVPVNTIDCTVPANATLSACTKSTPASASSMAARRADTGTAAAATPTNLDTFIASRKAAELQGGAYMPIILTTWVHDKDPYGFTLGPIAKVGFITPTDTVDANGNTVPALSQQNFYTQYGFGTRLGLSKLSYSHDVAPDLISYFDVMMGRYSQFDNNILPYGADPATYRFHRPWRFAFEGAFKIPTLPFMVGVSANVHQNFGLGKSDTVNNAKDDLRFFFGTKFDVGNLFGKLKNLN